MILHQVNEADDFLVAKGKAYTPASHVVRFGKRIELDADFFGTRRLQEADRLLTIKTYGAISEITGDDDAISSARIRPFLHKRKREPSHLLGCSDN